MPVALQTSVDIELLIEDVRDELFKRITSQAPYVPPGHVPHKLARTSQASSGHASAAQPLNFLVQDSFLSDDGSERVFKVQCGTFKCYYYAFKFNDYVACPAFLVSRFKLTDFACLDVSNGSHYYYIFLSRKYVLQRILDKRSDFSGEFELKMPSEAHKLLPLNPRYKDLELFIFPYTKNKKLRDECEGFWSNQSDLLIKLKAAPAYWFVPHKLMILFKARHSLFNFIYYASTILVHEDSKSFAELQEIMKPITKSLEDAKLFTATLKSIFTATKYKREDYILNAFANHIRRNFEDSSKRKLNDYYCSIIPVLQSSGYGKSKLMDRLGSRTPTFYSSLQLGAGYPGKSFFLTRLFEELNRIILQGISYDEYCHMNTVSTAVYIYILRMLFIILKNPDNNSLKNAFQIDSEIEGHKFFSNTASKDESEKKEEIFKILFNGLEDICKYEACVWFDGNDTLKLKNISIIRKFFPNKFAIEIYSEEALTCNLENDVMKLLKKLGKKNGLPSLFVIDEALGLQYKGFSKDEKEIYDWRFQDVDLRAQKHVNIGKVAPFNILRRIFRIFTNTWEHIMLIVISNTSGEICASAPPPEPKMDPSFRPQTSISFIEHFVLVQTFNVNSEIVQFITAETFPDWDKFLKSDVRKIEYFKLGRPLIYGIFLDNVKYLENVKDPKKYNLESKFDDCGEFKFMATKLFGGKEYGLTDKIDLLFGMFNFAFGTNFLPSNVSKEDLIENHLMTLVEFLDKDGVSSIIGGFLPEGVINFLSARYFVQFPASLIKVFNTSAKCGLCNIGNFGGLLAQFILLQNIFKCIDSSFQKVRKLVFQPVFLKDFLLHLAGAQYESFVNKYFKINDLLEGSQISFGYFEHFPKSPIDNPFDLMARLLFRGSAATLNSYYPGVDLLIPLVLGDKKISFVAIQVKFITKDKDVDSTPMKMNFRNMFPDYQGGQNNRPFVSIILVIGDSPLTVSIQRQGGLKASENQNYSLAPLTLVFKGVQAKDINLPEIAPPSTTSLHSPGIDLPSSSHNLTPNASYHGMEPEYLKKCDRLYDLTQEISQEEANRRLKADRRLKAQRTELEGPSPKSVKLDTSLFDVADRVAGKSTLWPGD